MKNKALIFNLVFSAILAGIISIFCVFNLFEKLDFRLYDGLIHLTKDPPMDDKVVVVAISDEDITFLVNGPGAVIFLQMYLSVLKN